MAYLGGSSNFDLDDDGILRDSMSGTDLLIDDDGILRDDDPDLDPYKHVTRGHWTDSGIGGDKQSSTSTLQHMQNSFEEDLPPIGDESINISEFEASKDDLSFDRVGDEEAGAEMKGRRAQEASLDLMDTLGSTLDKPDTRDREEDLPAGSAGQQGSNGQRQGEDVPEQQLFTDEYYKQLRDLGVLVDGVDLSRDSLNEFEEMESRVASRMDGGEEEEGTRDLIGEYLASEYQKEKEEQEEEERERDEAEDEKRRQDEEQSEAGVARTRFHVQHGGEPGFEVEEPGGRYSRASSGRTISSRSFPGDEDDDDDEAGVMSRRRRRRHGDYDDESDYDYDKENVNLSQNLGSQGGSQSQKTQGDDDDEIYNITSRILPASPGSGKPVVKAARRGGSRPESGASTPNRRKVSRGHSPLRGRHGKDSNDDIDDARSVHSETGPYQRPTSASSHISTASELVSRRQKKAEEAALNRIASARSQESFFQQGASQESAGGRRTGTPTHKRLLPQPSGGAPGGGQDLNHSFKVKSKSSGSISNTGPLKPTHSSLTEVSKSSKSSTLSSKSGAVEGGGGSRRGSFSADRSRLEPDGDDDRESASGALSDRLTQEAQKRKQATELVQQLQKDYDNLLTKYALAELTIDQMRLDGRVTIHTDSPTPAQATSGVMSPSVMGGATIPQVMSLRQSPAQQGVMLRSSPASLGHASPFTGKSNLQILLFCEIVFTEGSAENNNYPYY
ncbi:At-hook-containing transcription factor [Plakobranchus ocellatus]|uniref:At-hook-containing transcription factor n=1 Tax=Plakobranchus ocellatus TaxID=259542 RepID=A0AAV3Z2V5_9GAST|nr:At-hook-containing transcription factor [Plakobranchus ocellatus]